MVATGEDKEGEIVDGQAKNGLDKRRLFGSYITEFQ